MTASSFDEADSPISEVSPRLSDLSMPSAISPTPFPSGNILDIQSALTSATRNRKIARPSFSRPSTSSAFTSPAFTSPTPTSNSGSHQDSWNIVDYTPSTCSTSESVKMLLCINPGLPSFLYEMGHRVYVSVYRYPYSCIRILADNLSVWQVRFGDQLVEAEVICPWVLRCFSPVSPGAGQVPLSIVNDLDQQVTNEHPELHFTWTRDIPQPVTSNQTNDPFDLNNLSLPSARSVLSTDSISPEKTLLPDQPAHRMHLLYLQEAEARMIQQILDLRAQQEDIVRLMSSASINDEISPRSDYTTLPDSSSSAQPSPRPKPSYQLPHSLSYPPHPSASFTLSIPSEADIHPKFKKRMLDKGTPISSARLYTANDPNSSTTKATSTNAASCSCTQDNDQNTAPPSSPRLPLGQLAPPLASSANNSQLQEASLLLNLKTINRMEE